MKNTFSVSVMVVGLLWTSAASAAPRKTPRKAAVVKKEAPPAAVVAPAVPTLRGPEHVEYGEHTVTGQFPKQGGIYVVERKELPMKSFLSQRHDFRTETAATLR